MGIQADRFVRRLLAASLLQLAGSNLVCAEDFHTPSITAVRVEWRSALDQLRTEIGSQPEIAANFAFTTQRRVPASDPRAMPALVQLNAATSQVFNGIGRSPIPVLLPFDAAAWLGARQNGAPDELARFQADFRVGPLPCRACRLRRDIPAAPGRRRRDTGPDICKTGRGADHRIAPDL